MLQAIILIIIIIATTLVVASKHELFSIVGVGMIGLIAYSVPSIFGFTYAYDEGSAVHPVSDLAVFIHIIFWAVFFIIIVFSGRSKKTASVDKYKMSVVATACLYVSIFLYIWISLQDSPLFFLGERQIGETSVAAIVKIIWSWVVAFGLIASLISKRQLMLFYFIFMAFINMIAGDRGLPVFIIMSIFVIILSNYDMLSILKNVRIYIMLVFLMFIVFMAKPFYNLVKTGDYDSSFSFFSEWQEFYFVKSFEPFIIHNTLELVIEDGFSYEILYLIKGILGQLLLFPSLFGVSSAEWNRQFQDFLNQDLGYGIAYSYMAQAYSIGGLTCVIAFAALFSFTLIFFNKTYHRLSGLTALFVLQLGVVWGVFIYRNSLENMIAIFKQIFIAYLIIYIVYYIVLRIKPSSKKLHYSQYDKS